MSGDGAALTVATTDASEAARITGVAPTPKSSATASTASKQPRPPSTRRLGTPPPRVCLPGTSMCAPTGSSSTRPTPPRRTPSSPPRGLPFRGEGQPVRRAAPCPRGPARRRRVLHERLGPLLHRLPGEARHTERFRHRRALRQGRNDDQRRQPAGPGLLPGLHLPRPRLRLGRHQRQLDPARPGQRIRPGRRDRGRFHRDARRLLGLPLRIDDRLALRHDPAAQHQRHLSRGDHLPGDPDECVRRTRRLRRLVHLRQPGPGGHVRRLRQLLLGRHDVLPAGQRRAPGLRADPDDQRYADGPAHRPDGPADRAGRHLGGRDHLRGRRHGHVRRSPATAACRATRPRRAGSRRTCPRSGSASDPAPPRPSSRPPDPLPRSASPFRGTPRNQP